MKRISTFLNYINESNEISTEVLDDYLISIKDLGIDYQINPATTITEGKFAGRSSMTVQFNLSKLETSNISPSINREIIIDSKVWEFLNELITFKDRVNSDRVGIHFGSIGAHWRIGISFLIGDESKSGKDFELLRLYKIIKDRSLSGKSDFHHSIVSKLIDDKIIINCKEYTDRKFNVFLRGVDLSAFNVEKKIWTDPSGINDIIITHK